MPYGNPEINRKHPRGIETSLLPKTPARFIGRLYDAKSSAQNDVLRCACLPVFDIPVTFLNADGFRFLIDYHSEL